MGRNSTQPKIKIKIKTVLQRTKLHTGIFRLHLLFCYNNFPAHCLQQQLTMSQNKEKEALFPTVKVKQLKQFTLRLNNEDLPSSCNFLVCGCDHLTIRIKPLQRYFEILSTDNGMLGNSHFWNCLTKSCGVTMQNLAISSSFTCLSVLNVTWEWMGKQNCCTEKRLFWGYLKKKLHNLVQNSHECKLCLDVWCCHFPVCFLNMT